MTDKKGKCRFCGTEAYKTEEEATRKLIQVYKNLDRQREAWAIDVIKAAVEAIEDVLENRFDTIKDTLFNTFTQSKMEFVDLNSLKQFLEEHLNPHLEALKGLIDD
jgi:hypothetical protein